MNLKELGAFILALVGFFACSFCILSYIEKRRAEATKPPPPELITPHAFCSGNLLPGSAPLWLHEVSYKGHEYLFARINGVALIHSASCPCSSNTHSALSPLEFHGTPAP